VPRDLAVVDEILRCAACGARLRPPADLTPRFRCGRCGAVALRKGPPDLTGRTLAGYRILKKLGEGGAGVVYLAEQVSLGRYVALKALKPHARPADLVREAKTAARISHPNIVAIFDVGQADGLTYVAMEYVKGATLRQLLRLSGPMPIPRTLAIIRQVAAALARAHRERLVHGDIKPENILVDSEGLVRVADFGLAHVLAGGGSAPLPRKGTPCYVSPEQARGKPCDGRSDIYSAGATLFEMLSGRPPHTGDTPKEVLAKVAVEPAPELSVLRPDVPERLSALVRRMLAKSPDERPRSAEDVLAELDAIERDAGLSESGAFAAPEWQRAYAQAVRSAAGPDRARGATWPAAVAVTAAVLAVAAAGYVYWRTYGLPGQGPPERGAETARAGAPKQKDRAGEALYRAALQYARGNPQDYRRIIAKFEEVASAAPGSEFSVLARREAGAARSRLAAERRRLLQQIREKVDRLVSEDRFGEALAACEPTEAVRRLGIEDRVRALRDEVSERGLSRYAELQGEFWKALRADDLASAERWVEKIKRLGHPRLKGGAVRLEQELARRRKQAQAESAYDAEADLYLILQEANHLASERRYGDARRFIGKMMRNPRYRAIRDRLAKEQACLDLANALYGQVGAYLAAHPGTEIRVKGIAGRFRELRDGLMHVETDAGELVDSLENLSPKEMARLAQMAAEGLPEKERSLRLGAFFMYEQRFGEARESLLEAKRAGADGADTSYALWRLGLFAEGRLEEAEKTALARRALFRLRSARERKDWRTVLEQVSTLKELWDLPVVAAQRAEILGAGREAFQRLRRSSRTLPGAAVQ